MDELMSTSLQLMFVGMGVVFSFLVLLVFTIKLMAYLLGKYVPEQQLAPPAKIQPVVSTVGNDAAVTAAIGVAVHQFRKNNPKR